MDQLAIGGHDIGCHQIVAAQAMPAAQPADAAGKSEARHARSRDQSTRGGAVEGRRRRINVCPCGSTFNDAAIKSGSHAHPIHG